MISCSHWPSNEYMHQWTGSPVIQVIACCQLSTKLLLPEFSVYWMPRNMHQWAAGTHFNIKTIFTCKGIPITRIWRSWDHLIFIMENTILARWHLYTEIAPWFPKEGSRWQNEEMKIPPKSFKHMVSQDIFEGCVLRKNVSLRYKLSWANYFYTNAVKFVLIWICILWTFQKYHKKWGYSTSFFRCGWKYITKSFFLETQSPPNGPWIVLSELLSRLVNKTMCTYRKFLVIILFWTWCRFKRIMKP